jgi:hypothetical protein
MLMTKMADQCDRGEPFDIYAYFKRFTIDTMWSCGFGIDTDMQNNVNDPHLVNSQQFFTRTKIRHIIFILILLLKELTIVLRSIFQLLGIVLSPLQRFIPGIKKLIDESPYMWIMKQAREMINKRKQIGHTHRTDLLQLMVESMSDEDFIQVRFSSD